MLENLQNLALTLILAILCGTVGWLVRTNKQRILAEAALLIQKAESAIQGSGLGAEKKALVVAQLAAAGVTVNSWLSAQIDTIVATLNSKGAWLAEQVQETVAGLTDTVSDSDTKSDSNA